MRVFVRMDISVIQHRGKFQYIVNELTRSHQTALFFHWGRAHMDFLIQDLASVLHFIAVEEVVRRIASTPGPS